MHPPSPAANEVHPVILGERSRGNFLGLRILLCMVPGLAGLHLFAHAQSGPAISRDASIAKLQSDIPELMKQGDVPGMSIAVIRGGKVFWHNNFGVKNMKSANP